MDNERRSLVPGAAGVLTGLAAAVTVPLYFLYSGAPPIWNVLTRDLCDLVICAFFIVFVAGLYDRVRRAATAPGWASIVLLTTGLTYVGLTLVSTSLEAGAVYNQPDRTVDPTTDGPLAAANILMHGSIGRLITAMFLAAAGYLASRTGALPRWVGRAAYAVAAINIAFVPAMYFGTDPAHFYSATGWGNTALTNSLVLYWSLAAGIGMLRRPVSRAGTTAGAPVPTAA